MSGNKEINADKADAEIGKRCSFIRKILSSVDIVFKDPTKDKRTHKVCIAWNGFKCIVFLLCLAYLIKQSAEFYRHFHTYPTNSNTRMVSPKSFENTLKLPATTLCYRNRISAGAFCKKYSKLCERPRKADEYCFRHPQFCPKNILDLVIPKHGYFTAYSKNVSEKSKELLFNRSDDIPYTFFNPPRKRGPTVSFIRTLTAYVKCYSENLHLYQSIIEQRVLSVDSTFLGAGHYLELYHYNLSLHDEESFVPWGPPQAFFTIHSPFNPINDFDIGHPIRSGFTYMIDVKLEEDHLLPPPYATNCKNYNVKLESLNETKPRSQEICKELCMLEFYRQCAGCDLGLTMRFTTNTSCESGLKGCNKTSLTGIELGDKMKHCLTECSPDCIKLKYPYTVREIENEVNRNTGIKDQNATIIVYLKHLDIKVLEHKPFYTESELFSYIGGLGGCWLGISVFALTDIFEKFIKAVSSLKRNYRRKKIQMKIRIRKKEKVITEKRKKDKRSKKMRLMKKRF